MWQQQTLYKNLAVCIEELGVSHTAVNGVLTLLMLRHLHLSAVVMAVAWRV